MRKFWVILAFAILAAVISVSAANADSWMQTNYRQRSNLYLKAGQTWIGTDIKGLPKATPVWLAGGGFEIRITEDSKWRANIEYQGGLFKSYQQASWFLSYKF